MTNESRVAVFGLLLLVLAFVAGVVVGGCVA